MKSLLTDPVVLISSAAVLLGVFGFFWGIAQFRKSSKTSEDEGVTESLPVDEPPIPSISFQMPSVAPSVGGVATSGPPVSREVADRLESMTQRLSEMQAVLMKQTGSGAASAAGGVGQGFSPETIDKLLKIVGNVIQQVDILQKSLNATK